MPDNDLRLKTLAGIIRLAKSSMTDEELGQKVRAALDVMTSVEVIDETLVKVIEQSKKRARH